MSFYETIEVKYFDPEMQKLEKHMNGDWIDLMSREEVTLHPGDSLLIPLGVAMKLPFGYEAIVAPRSSTFKRYGILMSNSIGVIDNSYCGDMDEWKFPAYATKEITIPKYTRICQFRILQNQPTIDFKEVRNLSDKSRGGFGSTGQ